MKTWAIRILEYPQFEHVGGRRPWRVTKPLIVCINGYVYRVPEGYLTDFASVPRIPGVYWRYGNKATIPALWHDWLYDGCEPRKFTRKEADEMFLAKMEMLNDPPGRLRRRIMYRAVRMFGWLFWQKNPSWGCPK